MIFSDYPTINFTSDEITTEVFNEKYHIEERIGWILIKACTLSQSPPISYYINLIDSIAELAPYAYTYRISTTTLSFNQGWYPASVVKSNPYYHLFTAIAKPNTTTMMNFNEMNYSNASSSIINRDWMGNDVALGRITRQDGGYGGFPGFNYVADGINFHTWGHYNDWKCEWEDTEQDIAVYLGFKLETLDGINMYSTPTS